MYLTSISSIRPKTRTSRQFEEIKKKQKPKNENILKPETCTDNDTNLTLYFGPIAETSSDQMVTIPQYRNVTFFTAGYNLIQLKLLLYQERHFNNGVGQS